MPERRHRPTRTNRTPPRTDEIPRASWWRIAIVVIVVFFLLAMIPLSLGGFWYR